MFTFSSGRFKSSVIYLSLAVFLNLMNEIFEIRCLAYTTMTRVRVNAPRQNHRCTTGKGVSFTPSSGTKEEASQSRKKSLYENFQARTSESTF